VRDSRGARRDSALVGSEHPHKVDAQVALERLTSERCTLVTSSEVFQEVLHRYLAIGRREKIEHAFQALRGIVDEVLAVEEVDVFAAKDLVNADRALAARDALHVAVMHDHEITQILSFNRGFDAVPGIARLPAL